MSLNSLTSVNPYLFFSGNCRKSMDFYQGILGGKLDIMPFEGSPLDVSSAYKQRVMHGNLMIGNISIMASDGMPGQEIVKGGMTSVSLNFNDVEEAETVFNSLSEGGKISMAFQETFWGAKFGSFTDKFGIDWMVNCEIKK